jgi:hypothetical protein
MVGIRKHRPQGCVMVWGMVLGVTLSALAACETPGRGAGAGSGEGGGVKELIREATHGVYAGADFVTDVYWMLTDRCMAEEGYPNSASYRNVGTQTSVSGDFEGAESAQLDLWFGVSTAEWGAKYGYHEVPQSALFTVETIEGEPGPPGYEQALSGPPGDPDAHGCMWHAEQIIGEGTPSRDDLGAIQLEVERQVKSRVRVDASVASAEVEWSACMSAEGYRYGSPRDAFDAFAPFVDDELHAYDSATPSDDEKRVAEADGACKESVRFWDSVQEATDTAEEVVAVEMRSELETVRMAHERMVENANTALASQ